MNCATQSAYRFGTRSEVATSGSKIAAKQNLLIGCLVVRRKGASYGAGIYKQVAEQNKFRWATGHGDELDWEATRTTEQDVTPATGQTPIPIWEGVLFPQDQKTHLELHQFLNEQQRSH
jgi:hypothetical protein